MEHNFERLKAHILPLSQAKSFEAARLEWRLVQVEISDEVDHCPCGQEIREHCFIYNDKTRNTTFVGNVCVHRFIGIDTGTLFDGLKRIRQDLGANANVALIHYAQQAGFLYEKEFDFLMSTVRKRKVSDRQIAWKRKINRRILEKIVVRKRSTESDARNALDQAQASGVLTVK